MRKIFLVVFLFTSLAVSAQFTTGTKVLGGEFDFLFFNERGTGFAPFTQKGLTVHPSVIFSKFTTPTILAGFGVDYNYQYNNTNNNPSNQRQYYNSIGLFYTRMKLFSLAKKFYFTVSARAGGGYVFSNTLYPGNSSQVEDHNRGLNLYVTGRVGLLYHLNQRLFFTADFNNLLALSYQHSEITNNFVVPVNNNKVVSDDINLQTGLSDFNLSYVQFGIKWLLKK